MLRYRLFTLLARPELSVLWHLPLHERKAVLARVRPDIDAALRVGFWPTVGVQAAVASVLASGWQISDGIGPGVAFLIVATCVSAGVWVEYLVVARHIRPLVLAAVREQGHCPSCGYDLRACPDRCPECGAVPAGERPNPEGT